jgi:hypothetical protein
MGEWDATTLRDAHLFCIRNQYNLASSRVCACFYCCRIFEPCRIEKWIDDRGGRTAQCPHCLVDSVIGDASGYPVDDIEFLKAMHDRWFSGP